MKRAFVLCLIAVATGCSAAAPEPRVPAASPPAEPIVLPAVVEAPPGSMDFDWQPTEAPPPKKVVPRKFKAQPQYVAPTHAKGRLVALPTKREN